jgi:hypothetical protein
MITHKQLRIVTLALLFIVTGMIVVDFIWLQGIKSFMFALAYWGLCSFLTVTLILLALADMRYLKVKRLFMEQNLFSKTMSDEEFVRSLKKKVESEKEQDKNGDNRTDSSTQ